jgi:nitrate/nitrite transporter NarK
LSIGLLLAASVSGICCGSMISIPKICARESEVALWVGIMNAAGNVGGVLAPLVTGIVVARTGSYVPAFVTAALVLLVGIAAYTLIVPSLDQEATDRLPGSRPLTADR